MKLPLPALSWAAAISGCEFAWWRTRLFSNQVRIVRSSYQTPVGPPRWLQTGRVLILVSASLCSIKRVLFAGRYLGSLLFFTITPSAVQVSVGSVCKGIRNHILFITSAALDSGSPGPTRSATHSFQKLINKRLKVSLTSERAHALCTDDTWTDCVICLCPSDPAAEMWLLSDSSSGCT